MNSPNDTPSAPIGLRVQMLRQAAGWSLTDLAKKSGVARSQVHQIENGTSSPTYDTIIKLCQAFQCRPAVLTDGLFDIQPTIEHLAEMRRQWGR